MSRNRSRFGYICAVATLACVVVAFTSQAMAFRRQSSITGPGGRTVTNSATTTGPAQQSVNRTSQGQWNPATKTWNNTTTYSGPQGNSYDVNRSTTVTR